MRRLAMLCLVFACGCTMTVQITSPYCPVSDSAKAAADSVPLGCTLPDSVKR